MIGLTFVYCEGSHDLAFLSKLIKTTGLTVDEVSKVKDLPVPIQKLVSSALNDVASPKLRIDKPLNVFFPNNVLELANGDYLCIFTMGGKENLQAALDNVEKSKLLIKTKLSGISNVKHAFVLDADYKLLNDGSENPNGGISKTLKVLSDRIKEKIPDFEGFNEHAQWKNSDDYGQIGAYIFTGECKEEGTLEDLIDNLIKPKDLELPANNYIDNVKAFDQKNDNSEKDKTKIQKIKLTSITQAFHPGASLAVGLSNDHLLDLDLLHQHNVCEEFKQFIS